MQPYLTLITLGVADLDRSLAFYRDGLGWQPFGPPLAEVAFIKLNGVILSLYLNSMLAADASLPPPADGFGGITLAHNVPSPAEVEAALALAERAGGRILKPPHQAHWGGTIGFFADPDGHVWEVAHNPHWGLDPQGFAVIP